MTFIRAALGRFAGSTKDEGAGFTLPPPTPVAAPARPEPNEFQYVDETGEIQWLPEVIDQRIEEADAHNAGHSYSNPPFPMSAQQSYQFWSEADVPAEDVDYMRRHVLTSMHPADVREYVRSIHMLGDAHFLGMSGNIVESHSLYRAQIAFPSNPDRAVELTEIRQELARIDRLRMIDGGLRFYEGQDLAFERAEADDQAGVGEWVFEAVPEDFEYR